MIPVVIELDNEEFSSVRFRLTVSTQELEPEKKGAVERIKSAGETNVMLIKPEADRLLNS